MLPQMMPLPWFFMFLMVVFFFFLGSLLFSSFSFVDSFNLENNLSKPSNVLPW